MKLLAYLPAFALGKYFKISALFLAFTGRGIVSDPNIVQMKKVAI
jgi:hypothetical protein